MQLALKSEGFYKGPVDGFMGAQTRQAIKEFQKVNRLQPDGIIGKKTYGKLGRLLNEKNVRISSLNRQLAKLREDNFAYKAQVEALKEENAKKDKQTQELDRQLKSEKEKYQEELAHQKELARIKDSQMAQVAREREYLAEEKLQLERLQGLRNQELMRIKKSLENIISAD